MSEDNTIQLLKPIKAWLRKLTCRVDSLEQTEWTNSTRPADPRTGQSGYNSEADAFEYWNGTAWVVLN